MTDQSLWYLENIDVTGVFRSEKLQNDHDGQELREFRKGEYIYQPNERSDSIYFLTSGRVKIGSNSAGGKEITKAILTKGEIFGELALLGEKRRPDFACAMEKTTVCIVTVGEMHNLMRKHKMLNIFLMRVLGSRVHDLEERLESLIFKDSRSRIIDFLIGLVRKEGRRLGYEHIVQKFITHQEIANFTATSRQTVTTVLNELRNKNLLTFDRKRLLVRDIRKLAAEAS